MSRSQTKSKSHDKNTSPTYQEKAAHPAVVKPRRIRTEMKTSRDSHQGFTIDSSTSRILRAWPGTDGSATRSFKGAIFAKSGIKNAHLPR